MPPTLVTSPPYTPRVPPSSNCQTFQSTDVFAAQPTVSFSIFFLLKHHHYRVILTPFNISDLRNSPDHWCQ